MITILDYGLGNVRAFANLYKRLNIEVEYASTTSQLSKASKIILPGVGAFDHAMETLDKSGLRECLDELVLSQSVPVIGICVGMQMMAEGSEEGVREGLAWIKGTVKHFDHSDMPVSREYPLPKMGWNNITPVKDSKLLTNLDEFKRFYFLHSYYVQCENHADVIATANYGFDYDCIVNHKNVYGIQCHPEKSHHNGMALLKNFAEI
jgi:glutamine amidotransferase